MNDQAATLRRIRHEYHNVPQPGGSQGFGRCIAVTGGKGGVGKSNLAVNLSLELGALKKKVGLIDGDFALANADLLCGVTPKFHLGHVVVGTKGLSDIAIQLADTVRLIPGGSGLEQMAHFSILSNTHLLTQMQKMESEMDFLLFDTAAGLGDNVAGVLSASTEVIIVATPDPTSIIDAYATIKMVQRRSPGKKISVVVNDIVGMGEAERVFRSIQGAVLGFLDRPVDFLGMVPHDASVQEAIREQTPVVTFAPNSPASRAIRLIAKQLVSAKPAARSPKSFWDKLARN